MLAGRVSVGGVVTTTVTVKVPLAVLLCASVAEQWTVVVPRGKRLPEGGVQVMGRMPSTRSEAEAANDTKLPEGLVASTVILEGRVREGGVVSTTVTVKVIGTAWLP
jgi:hypothetical protein